MFYGKANSALGNFGPYFAHLHYSLSSSEELYLWSISECKPPYKSGLAFLFVVLYCSFICILTVDIENKSTLLGFHLGSPFAFE